MNLGAGGVVFDINVAGARSLDNTIPSLAIYDVDVTRGFPYPGLLTIPDAQNFPNRRRLTFANFSSSLITNPTLTYSTLDNKRRTTIANYKVKTVNAYGLTGTLLNPQLVTTFSISSSYARLTTTTTTTTTSTSTTTTTVLTVIVT
jgi:hypothetical protein